MFPTPFASRCGSFHLTPTAGGLPLETLNRLKLRYLADPDRLGLAPMEVQRLDFYVWRRLQKNEPVYLDTCPLYQLPQEAMP